MQQDDQHAGERQQHAKRLRRCQPHAEQQQRPHRDDQRARRLQQQRVQRLGMLQRPVLHGVEGADPGDRQHHHDAELLADRGPVAHQMVPRKRQDQQEGETPAQERQRHRRNVPGGKPADDGIAGPAQRGDGQQQIRLPADPGPGSRAVLRRMGDRHSKVQTRIPGLHQWRRCIVTMRGPSFRGARSANPESRDLSGAQLRTIVRCFAPPRNDGEENSRRQRMRMRTRRDRGIVRIELDLQAALAAIDEHGHVGERRLLRSRPALSSSARTARCRRHDSR